MSPKGPLPTSLCSVAQRYFAEVTLQCHPKVLCRGHSAESPKGTLPRSLQCHPKELCRGHFSVTPRNFAEVTLQCHPKVLCLLGLARKVVVFSVAGSALLAAGDL